MVKGVIEKLTMADGNLRVMPRTNWIVSPSTVSDSSGKQRANLKAKEIPKNDGDSFQAYFEVCKTERHVGEAYKIVVRSCIESTQSLSALRTRDVMDYLMDKRMYVNQSVFEQLEEKSVGWLVSTHHRHSNRSEIVERMTKEINRNLQEDPSFGLDGDSPARWTKVTPKKSPNKSPNKAGSTASSSNNENNLTTITEEYKAPPFKLVMGKVMLFEENGTVTSTDALRIRCEASEGNRVRNLLTALSSTKIAEFDNFIPFGVTNTKEWEKTVKRLIKMQTKYLDETQLIKIVGLSKEGLEAEIIEQDENYVSMRSILMSRQGISAVFHSPGFNRHETHVIVRKAEFDAAKAWIDTMLDNLCDDTMIDLTKLIGEGCIRIRRVHVGGAATDTVTSYMSILGSRCAEWSDKEFDAIPNRRASTNAWQQRGPPSYIVSHNNNETGAGDEKTVATATSIGSAIDKGNGTVMTQLTNVSTIEAMITEKTEAMQKQLQEHIDAQLRQAAENNQAHIDKLNAKVEDTSNQISQLSQSLPASITSLVTESTNVRFEAFEQTLARLMHQVTNGFAEVARNMQPAQSTQPPQFQAQYNHSNQYNSGETPSPWNDSMQQSQYDNYQQGTNYSPQLHQSTNYSQTQSTNNYTPTPPNYQNYEQQQQHQQQQSYHQQQYHESNQINRYPTPPNEAYGQIDSNTNNNLQYTTATLGHQGAQ